MADKVVLGISPGTRVLGLAVIRDGELAEWRVKGFKETWSSEKHRNILSTIHKLCEYHGVRILSVKKIDPLRSSPQLDRLIRNLIKQAKRHGIKVIQYSLSDLDYNLRTGKKQTKDNISAQVAEKHQEVRNEYLRERNNRREYYTKMFEAIAMAEQYRE
jgi:Holliday junction resolvasome RuvABC endonuclease subunit